MLTVESRTYKTLRRKLLTGELPAGARLSALALSKTMSISPTPVMQAIRRLATEGLVGVVPHFGAFVREPSVREVAELFDMRRALEAFSARRAARRATPQQVDKLAATCDLWQSTIDQRRTSPNDERAIAKSIEADLMFHMYIMDIAGNRRAIKVFRDCHLLTRVFGSHAAMQRHAPLETEERDLDEHRRVLDAIRRRAPGAAARAIDAHLRTGRRRLTQHMRDSRGKPPPAQPPALTRAIVQALTKIENYRMGSV